MSSRSMPESADPAWARSIASRASANHNSPGRLPLNFRYIVLNAEPVWTLMYEAAKRRAISST